MRRICVTWLGAVISPSAPHKTGYPGVNRTMAVLRGVQYVELPSPSKALGMQRTGVRQSVPQDQDRE